jgi:hypothetical protein
VNKGKREVRSARDEKRRQAKQVWYRFWSSQILGTAEQAKQWLREFTQGNYYLGGAVNPRNIDMIALSYGKM